MGANTNQSPPIGPLILSLLITVVGVGWLLSAWGIGAGINWVWTLALGALGVLTFVLSGGLDKFSLVVGPFFLVSSLFSVLRQTKQLDVNTELPLLVILVGALMTTAQMRWVSVPSWYVPLERDDETSRGNR